MKKKVFIIEDDMEILGTIEELLTDEGYEVLTAKNGQDAIDQLKTMSQLPQLILLDLMMPIKDGIGFREDQTEDSRLKEIPVILMSADGQIEAKKLKMGIENHLKKPLDIDVLLTLIETNILAEPCKN